MQLSWRSSRKDFEWCNPYFKGFWAYNGDGSLFCWCVTGSVVALGDVRALVVKHTHTHSGCALLPTTGRLFYCNTWPRVSGNFVARKLPAARAPAANMMGTALVMPTNDWKMLMPRTAASLQRAFRKPNAVHLNTREEEHSGVSAADIKRRICMEGWQSQNQHWIRINRQLSK